MSLSVEVTKTLSEVTPDNEQARDRLLAMVYDDMRGLAEYYLRNERANHTLQPTALVHEAFLKLVDSEAVDARGKSHFFAVGARAMRQILVDYARSKKTQKRGGGAPLISLDERLKVSPRRDQDVLALDEALHRLAELDPRHAQIVELRFFGGLTVAEVAQVLGTSKRSVEAEWTMIRAWLRSELADFK